LPPEILKPVEEKRAPDLVPLNPELQAKVDGQVGAFVGALLTEDIHSDTFRGRLDSAIRTMRTMRGLLDDLNPGKDGDLLVEQLGILDTQVKKIADGICRNDADALILNGRILGEKLHTVNFVG
jgi:hypothetical protein